MLTTLDEDLLMAASAELAGLDPALAASLTRSGPPPLWARDRSFGTLVHLVLEQQVSLASAQAAFDRLTATLDGNVAPERLLALGDEQMLAIGFSRQKRDYARGVAAAMLDGFDLDGLATLPDDEVRARLTSLRGIGRWTADVYLIMSLRRPDVWPHGDLTLARSAMVVLGLPERPTYEALGARAERWRPWRAVAARILWHDFLLVRGLPVD